MKKITVLNGSINRQGNTQFFIEEVLKSLPKEEYKIEFLFSEDYKVGLEYSALYDVSYNQKVLNDNVYELEHTILNSNLLVIASPVYMHNVSSSLKLVLEKLSTWAHILRLDGIPTVVLSTCSSNGDSTVTSYLCKIMSSMGGNIIANCNANSYQLDSENWLKEISLKITKKINDYINLPRKSNDYIEQVFQEMKKIMLVRQDFDKKDTFAAEESKYWMNNNLINYDSFQEYLYQKYNKESGV
ncbi:flavodoxin family protein [Limosilactobacillus reuteri]|mgnify:CR=1 FL=1|uniref:flavodoxin family protein n=1 Tax=Limosilactobacillus reuteri TaxID=1598 RepID=UPI00128CFC4E|nr:NAD(P)H-dependent oxidoreductase [Limosilactobacillus reuteri]MCC4358749.1 NAD(P)H-dependent oxidoreductase [Limosilactobacillus reuteri]MCC4363431.1 NAD(P)H-dependent oxidoreductase [Limosilactobacillus reuteri]MCC4365229.1 NAD(P)H-dependent oxidoreductase [Limosilactobacillus reuteri]MCC4368962.1 NAD(P)H-dependent oxidoreductase [Limosilactobacillus reuteri]MQB77219.1 hypothetical protein [Limosilactobacillus reuteri]